MRGVKPLSGIAKVYSLLLSDWYKNLSTQLVRPGIQESQITLRSEFTCSVRELSAQCWSTASRSWISAAMTREHVQIGDVAARRQAKFVDAKAIWIREVVTQLAV